MSALKSVMKERGVSESHFEQIQDRLARACGVLKISADRVEGEDEDLQFAIQAAEQLIRDAGYELASIMDALSERGELIKLAVAK